MRAFILSGLAAIFLFQASPAHSKQVIIGLEPGITAMGQNQALQLLGLEFVEALPEINAIVAEISDVRVSFAEIALQALITPGVTAVEEDVELNWLEGAYPSFQGTPLPTLSEISASLPRFKATPQEPALPPGVSRKELPWGIRRVNAPAAWAKTQGRGVRVAVVDTGIDSSHPDLKANYAGCYNAVKSGASCMDDNGHGTHVSGTIAGVLDGKGVAGVAPQARLYAVKVLKADGSGGLVSIIKGILWCAKNDIQVANMSLGAPIGTIFMRMAVNYAVGKGVTIVAAAGNDGKGVDCPACYSSSIAVSASDSSGKIADFSSRGDQVDFIAPGVSVKSSIPGGGYSWYSGTSMAAPHMSGLAALAVSSGARSPKAVRSRLKRAAKSLGLKPEEQGAGLVDAAKLVR